ncbi:MAG: Maf-like protein BWK73_16010 [uncultured Thiotrichaceae bacterium]|uniref:Nucleoside triphosphate pyrophosphatase n=1 Tax=uncultured Thiotrichaceae bacterium TaxID=298394 RepID=A0A6S6RW66_9GAMM|nr:MAG: Maf-like protein BWK73_16010 [uncultured Thiotrichaceae bacterium]
MDKLYLTYSTAAPNIDETPLVGESSEEMVMRLSLKKAKAVSERHSDALIIGSDQCAVLENLVMGKPGTHEEAIEQLRHSSGKTVKFLTGLCLYDAKNATYELECVPFEVEFRELMDTEIENYLRIEEPYNCAGSFKSEALGITLFNKMQGEDPSSLIGLPLIKLCGMLRRKGIALPPSK